MKRIRKDSDIDSCDKNDISERVMDHMMVKPNLMF